MGRESTHTLFGEPDAGRKRMTVATDSDLGTVTFELFGIRAMPWAHERVEYVGVLAIEDLKNCRYAKREECIQGVSTSRSEPGTREVAL